MACKSEKHMFSDFLRAHVKPSEIFPDKVVTTRFFHCGICDHNFGSDEDRHGVKCECPKCHTTYEIWGNSVTVEQA